MSFSLYRTYRPQRFDELTNQRGVVQALTNQLASSTTAHAYCFSGPRGVGKTTLARVFAKALNCTPRGAHSVEPCNTCRSCKEITTGSSLDCIEVDAASHTGVDNVRDNIISASRVATAGSQKKIFIIDEVHMLSISAFNALLKTLEEPPEHVVFILATTEVHKVPQTILSRCQRYQFSRISNDEIIGRLKRIVEQEHRKVDDDVLVEIASRSEGSLRDAETLLEQILVLEDGNRITMDLASLVIPQTMEREVLSMAEMLVGKDPAAAIAFLQRFIEDGGEPLRLFDKLIEAIREAMVASIAGREFIGEVVASNRREVITRIVESANTQTILRILDVLIRRRTMVNEAYDESLLLEMAMLESILGFPPLPRLEGQEAVERLL